MGLTTPLALLFSALVALPIIAHLLRRADVPTLRLPTVALLSRAAVESRRRPRLVDPGLFALRVAAVVLAAVALAAPFVERELAFGDGRLASVMVVIDDSMSMSRVEGRGIDALARERALAIVEALPEGSEVGLLAAGSPARVLVARTRERALVQDRLAASEPSAGTARGGDLSGALALANRQLAGARHALRRIVVLTDLRGALPDAELEAAPGIELSFERVGDDAGVVNLAITEASVEPRGEGAAVSVSVRAFGDGAWTRVPVSLVRGAQVLASGEVVLNGPTGSTLLELAAGSVSSAALETDPTARVRIEPGPDDALAADDERGVLLRASSAPRVALVDRASDGTTPSRFIEQALLLAPRTEGGPFSVRHVEPLALPSVIVGSVDVLVVLDVDLRDARLAEAVRAHVEGGAGLLVASGPHAGASSDVRVRDLLPAYLSADAGALTGLVRPAGSPLPVEVESLGLVRVDRHVVLEGAEDGDVILTFGDGSAAIVLSRERRTAVAALPLDDTWTDWPYRPAFLPAVVSVVALLARPGTMPDAPVAAGTLPRLELPAGVRAASIVAPSGAVVRVVGEGTPASASLAELRQSGAYAVSFETDEGAVTPAPRAAFVLAPEASESDLRVLPQPTTRAGESGEASGPALVRSDVSTWVFLLLGLAAIAEGALRLRRSRDGSDDTRAAAT